ncbi:MAG: group II intron maturase-specific domain-containing protein [Sulfuricella sp.]
MRGLKRLPAWRGLASYSASRCRKARAIAQLTDWWANYFHYRNSSGVLDKVRIHAEERLRTHLMKRHKVKDRGTGISRFPSQQLYTRYGLYKVPTTAGWKTAYA